MVSNSEVVDGCVKLFSIHQMNRQKVDVNVKNVQCAILVNLEAFSESHSILVTVGAARVACAGAGIGSVLISLGVTFSLFNELDSLFHE